jgi:hypothetical protein
MEGGVFMKNLTRVALMALLAAPGAFAQETTAGLQGSVKDPSGAVVVAASVKVTSPALIGAKTVVTDSAGNYRITNLPPGDYTITVSAAGFSTYKEHVSLSVGRLPSLDITMQLGAATEVVEVSAQTALIDPTQSKVQTNIPADILMNVPTQSRSFQSVIQFAPGARSESLQGGYQIDGASNSENSYLVEGQETASVGYGQSAVSTRIDFIQEVQIKTSGFEAEYGGALGGVVNMVQKRGSNAWHGSVCTYYNGSAFDAAPNPTLMKNPQVAANAGGAKRLDQPAENYQPRKDRYTVPSPGFTLGGHLIKDRLWIFAGSSPQFSSLERTVNFAPASGAPGARTFHQTTNTYTSMARVDFRATQKIRLYGSWSYSYQRRTGSSLPAADDAFGQFNAASTTNPSKWGPGIGFVAPNVVYNSGAEIVLNPGLILTTRFGYFYQDNQDRGLPTGVLYSYIYPTAAGTMALNGTPLPAQFVHPSGWSNIGNNYQTVFDQWKRYSFSQDLAFFKSGLGTHSLKFGYAFNHGVNNVLSGYNTASVLVSYNVPYGPQTPNGIARCQTIAAQNQALYGKSGGAPDGSDCQGLWGTVDLTDHATTGKVGGWNHAFYAQDAWTVGTGVTLNLGVRLDKENVPSYDPTTGLRGISFGWGQKVAPRLGAAWDALRNGKLKLYGSVGYFYDIMKYNLARATFGGSYGHDCEYALDTPDYTQIIPQRDAQGHYCPLGGGSAGAVGILPPGLRLIENNSFGPPSNDPNQAGTLGPTGLIDPNLKPMQQHELVIGAAWTLSPSLVFEPRYSRKRLDRTIEDAATITQDGEVDYIVNPGLGVNTVQANCNGCPHNPKASRNYEGLEFRLTKRTSKWSGSLSYTYSRLYGNYSGLTDTDVGSGGDVANYSRAFDEPFMSFDAHGKAIDGPLPTDRPHTVKAYGYYNLKWRKFNTLIGAFQQVYSGTPLSSYASVWGAPVFVEGRGRYVDVARDPATGDWIAGRVSSRRTPMFSQSDLSVSQEFHLIKTNERLVTRVRAEVFNIFNQHSPVVFNQNLLRSSILTPAICGTPGTNCTATESDQGGLDYGSLMTKGYDYIAQANTKGLTLNSLYGLPVGWQSRRSMLFALIVTF